MTWAGAQRPTRGPPTWGAESSPRWSERPPTTSTPPASTRIFTLDNGRYAVDVSPTGETQIADQATGQTFNGDDFYQVEQEAGIELTGVDALEQTTEADTLRADEANQALDQERAAASNDTGGASGNGSDGNVGTGGNGTGAGDGGNGGNGGNNGNPINSGQGSQVPQRAVDAAQYAQDNNGAAQPGYRGNDPFANDGRGGGQVLPQLDGNGSPITYTEYDVNPFVPGVGRGIERVVGGSDGSWWYTNDHYLTFLHFFVP